MLLNLSIGYSKEEPLYPNIEMEVNKGDVINIIGENGAGKSTLYKTLSGKIFPISGYVPKEMKECIAIVSDYISMPKELKVQDIFEFIGSEQMKMIEQKYEDIYKIVSCLEKQKIKDLSSGQKRLLEILSVLSSGKSILILDEACNALDYKNKCYFLNNVKRLPTRGVTIFNTSHNLEDVIELGGKIYILDKINKKIVGYEGEKSVEAIRGYMNSLGGEL